MTDDNNDGDCFVVEYGKGKKTHSSDDTLIVTRLCSGGNISYMFASLTRYDMLYNSSDQSATNGQTHLQHSPHADSGKRPKRADDTQAHH
jgi:hypothetical protein